MRFVTIQSLAIRRLSLPKPTTLYNIDYVLPSTPFVPRTAWYAGARRQDQAT
ncbi:hypothetical protein JW960_05275 [candidate division KSB1 bacterium]|nr:hypothetical protein [candidate division KSB1 bacterium]